jgi:hypothetical protein
LNEACIDNTATRTLSRLKRSGFLKVVDGRVLPTEKGLLIADRLPLMFDRSEERAE